LTDKINFDIAIEEFASKKPRKVSVYKIVVFVSEIKMVLIFYTFLLCFPICHFCFCLTVTKNVCVFGVHLKHTIFEHVRAL